MVFDTLKSVEELQEAGIPENQAKAQVRVFQRIIESDLATKRDIKDCNKKCENWNTGSPSRPG